MHGIVLVAALVAVGCAGRLEEVVRVQAAREMRCPADQIEVYDRRTGDDDVRDYTVVACGQTAHYQAACSMVDTCVAYRPRELGKELSEARAPEVEVVKPEEPAAPGEWQVVEVTRPKPPPQTELEQAQVVEAGAPLHSVNVHNTCPETIQLHIGATPGQGGRTMTLASTNMTTLRIPAGEMLWLLDAAHNGLTGVSLDASVHEVVAGCQSLVSR